ncbi:MAG: N4-gp56 family major capsid protein [Clostridia bacterium]|nr:N4-gp56 family major capsid protein [Clostridia bacterium]
MVKYLFNIRAFDSVLNASTSNQSGNDLSPEIKEFYSNYLIKLAEGELVHDQFGQTRDIPAGNGKTIEFRKITPLAKITTALVEGVTPDGQALDTSAMTAQVKQYGGYREDSSQNRTERRRTEPSCGA